MRTRLPEVATGLAPAALFGGAIFTGAFLLFQVQPLIARYILPWFGGSAAVWSTTLLFFQTALLAGYAYAHFIVNRFRLRTQVLVHVGLAIAALAVLPIVPAEALRPDGAGSPTLGVLVVLTVTVGAPYLLLAATGPLLQAWFGRIRPEKSPYRLYALSNAASLLGLLSYPLIVERYLSLRHQAWLWSGGYAAFVLATIAVARFVLVNDSRSNAAPQPNPTGSASPGEATRVGGGTRALWIALPATAVVMLLAVTNQMTLEIAQFPLLWVLPMTAYLLSFIFTFARPTWYRRVPFGGLAVVAMTLVVRTLVYDNGTLTSQIFTYTLGLLFITLVLHGELVRLTPPTSHLTAFYLMIATGGALGGVAVALVAPRVFPGLWELHVGLVMTAGIVGVIWLYARSAGTDTLPSGIGVSNRLPAVFASVIWIGLLALSAVMSWVLIRDVAATRDGVIAMDRSFYGVLRVVDKFPDNPLVRQVSLKNGPIEHGFQYSASSRADWATTYFSPASGVGVAIEEQRRYSGSQRGGNTDLQIGVVGLGAGTLAAYGQERDVLTFYEIDPLVVELSLENFSFVSRARARGASVEVLIGDARLVMETQLTTGRPRFDLLALDAFTGDAIPVHLLTLEAFDLYWNMLADDGTLAVHVSNKHLDLTPVVRRLAEIYGKEAILIENEANVDIGAYGADWMLVTSNPAIAQSQRVVNAATPWSSASRAPLLWTDDYSNLLALLK